MDGWLLAFCKSPRRQVWRGDFFSQRGLRGVEQENMTNQTRLEVSGILDAQYPSRIVQRVKEKMEQTKQSDYSALPAYVIVVEFGRPVVYMVKR